MPVKQVLVAFLQSIWVMGAALAAAPTPPANVPDAVLQKIADTFRPPRPPRSEEDHAQMMSRQMDEVLEFGRGVESKYPQAPNLHVVRSNMLKAADFLVRYRRSPEARKELLAVSSRLLNSDAPPDSKVTPDYYLTMEKLGSPGGAGPQEAEKEVRQFIQRYAGTDAEAAALIRATFAADRLKLAALHEQVLDRLGQDFPRDPAAHAVLRRLGRRPPFFAELTLLDGRKLSLPDDLKGKVVIVDFWATWCPPCLAALPHLRQVYAKYQPKGVEVVAISLDKAEAGQKLADFVKAKDLPWLHAYSGKYWDDPTAQWYEVRSIPSVWVIGKDGRIVSENARSDLEATLDRALAEPVGGAGTP